MFNPRNANAQSKNPYMVNINSRIWISVGILSRFQEFSIGILVFDRNFVLFLQLFDRNFV